MLPYYIFRVILFLIFFIRNFCLYYLYYVKFLLLHRRIFFSFRDMDDFVILSISSCVYFRALNIQNKKITVI